jgi:hypothetical protein
MLRTIPFTRELFSKPLKSAIDCHTLFMLVQRSFSWEIDSKTRPHWITADVVLGLSRPFTKLQSDNNIDLSLATVGGCHSRFYKV